MIRENQNVYERGPYWVLRDKRGYHVMCELRTHAESDSSYADLSLAVARADYLARAREPEGPCPQRAWTDTSDELK